MVEVGEADIRAVGFDLDGTLLDLDPGFISQYLDAMDRIVSPRLRYPRLSEAILASTAVMCAHDGSRPLADVFYEDFFGRTGLPREAVEAEFTRFYEKEFAQLSFLGRPVPGVHGVLAEVRGLGLKVALLTNPVFPAAAVLERLRWAGLEEVPFDWMASFEGVFAAKPQSAFYLEAARRLDIAPQHWLMVGNDLNDDILPAVRAGMQGYWTDQAGASAMALPDRTAMGPVQRLPEFLRQRMRP